MYIQMRWFIAGYRNLEINTVKKKKAHCKAVIMRVPGVIKPNHVISDLAL